MIAPLALIAVLFAVLFSGCGGLNENQVLSVRNRTNGKVLTIGDTREAAEKVTGGDPSNITDFDDGVSRYSYWDAEGLAVDYLDGKVVALRLSDEGRWEITGGVRIGMEQRKVEELYAANPYKEVGMEGGVLLSYDEQGNPVAFDVDAPNVVTISFKNGVVSYVGIQYNFDSDYYS